MSEVRRPIFVVGCGRSGTSMLFGLLGQHPRLARTTGYPDGEDHEGWIQHGQCVMAGIGNVRHPRYGSGINGEHYCLHMTAADVSEQVRGEMHRYYFQDVMQGDGTRRVINKNPHLSNKLGYVLGIFNDAKIVHIVRECRSVVASWLAILRNHPTLTLYWPADEEYPCFWLMNQSENETARRLVARHPRFYPGGGEALFVDYWLKTNTGIVNQMASRPDQLLTIRYEDLVADPARVLTAVTDFCELPCHAYAISEVEAGTAHRHTNLISEGLHALIEEQTATVRALFGYGPPGTS